MAEHHHHSGDEVEDETVHCQQMGDAAARIAEFAGREDVDHGGLDSDRGELAAAQFPGVFAFTPILEEVLCAALVHDVVERARRHQHDHEDDIRLHHGRRYGRRECSEWIYAEHHPSSPTILGRACERWPKKRLCRYRKRVSKRIAARSASTQVEGAERPATVPGLTSQVLLPFTFATCCTPALCEWPQHTRSQSPVHAIA